MMKNIKFLFCEDKKFDKQVSEENVDRIIKAAQSKIKNK